MPNASPIQPFTIRLLLMVLLAVACLSCRQPRQLQKPAAPSPSPLVIVGNGPPGYPPAVIGQPYQGTGVVKLINLKEGWIEIDHEEIAGLMPAMEMEWAVTDKSLLKAVDVGDNVDFTIVETGKGEYITSLKRKPGNR